MIKIKEMSRLNCFLWGFLNILYLHLLLRNPIDFFTNGNLTEKSYYTFRMELYVEDVLT